MSFTALKDAEDEKINNNYIDQLFALKTDTR